ncbi:MAG: hypothetical protein ACREVK_00245 [Gammaproteobacteria bacterium]
MLKEFNANLGHRDWTVRDHWWVVNREPPLSAEEIEAHQQALECWDAFLVFVIAGNISGPSDPIAALRPSDQASPLVIAIDPLRG